MRYLFLVISLICGSCGMPSDAAAPRSGIIDYGQDCACGVVSDVSRSGLFWLRMVTWSSPVIPVCWETTGHGREKGWIRDAVAQTWEAASAVRFTGWGECAQDAPGVHLAFGGTQNIRGIGHALDGVAQGVILPLENEYHTRIRATHAFGIVLGFGDAENRHDAPPGCKAPSTRWLGSVRFGPYDVNSVMSGCLDRLYWHGGVLSPGDRAGVQYVYGRPRSCGC